MVNGKVLTMEADGREGTAVAVTGEKISFIGADAEARRLAGTKTKIIDLKGRLLMPGFIESHMHPLMYAHNLLGVDCGGDTTRSLAKVLEVLAEKVAGTPKGEWIKGFGWDDSKFEEKRNPTRWDLDKVSPNHPVVLMRTCVHVVVANSMALKLGNIDKYTNDPDGGHIQKDPDTGEPTGILQERAMEMLPDLRYTFDQLKGGMETALQILARRGVTSIGDMSAQQTGFRIYQQLNKENKLTARVRLWPVAQKTILGDAMLDQIYDCGIESGFGNEMISIQGVKYVLDGSISGKTAAVTEPYYKETSANGIIYCSDESDMLESIRKAFRGGLRVSIHAIGDRAIEFALNIIEKAGEGLDLAGMRNRIEHCILPTSDQLLKVKRLGLVVGSSVGFLYPLGEGYLNALGPERVKSAIPQKSYEEIGIIAPANTDCPVCDLNPMLAIYGMVERRSFAGNSLGDAQRVGIMEALKAYTTYPAYSTFEEDKLGSIKEGKLADLAVLEKDIRNLSPEEIKDLKVALTIVNGRIVWNDGLL